MEQFQRPSVVIWFLPVFAIAILVEALLYRRATGRPYPWKESLLSLVITRCYFVVPLCPHLCCAFI